MFYVFGYSCFYSFGCDRSYSDFRMRNGCFLIGVIIIEDVESFILLVDKYEVYWVVRFLGK